MDDDDAQPTFKKKSDRSVCNMAGSVMLKFGFVRSGVTWAILNRNGIMPAVKDRLASIVMIAAKNPLYSFRRRSISGLLVTSWHNNSTKL